MSYISNRSIFSFYILKTVNKKKTQKSYFATVCKYLEIPPLLYCTSQRADLKKMSNFSICNIKNIKPHLLKKQYHPK